MQTDNSGKYITINANNEDINYYISKFIGFDETLTALLQKEPETRKAILEGKYKDLICLQMQAHKIADKLERLISERVLYATCGETQAAAGEMPDTGAND